jgi:hypothetical protein
LVRPYGMIGVALGTLIPSIVFRAILQPIVVQRLLQISMRKTALTYLRTGSRCAAFLALPWLITHFLLRPTYFRLFAVGLLSAIAYAIPVWWLEFEGVGAEKVASSLRSARRLLLLN